MNFSRRDSQGIRLSDRLDALDRLATMSDDSPVLGKAFAAMAPEFVAWREGDPYPVQGGICDDCCPIEASISVSRERGVFACRFILQPPHSSSEFPNDLRERWTALAHCLNIEFGSWAAPLSAAFVGLKVDSSRSYAYWLGVERLRQGNISAKLYVNPCGFTNASPGEVAAIVAKACGVQSKVMLDFPSILSSLKNSTLLTIGVNIKHASAITCKLYFLTEVNDVQTCSEILHLAGIQNPESLSKEYFSGKATGGSRQIHLSVSLQSGFPIKANLYIDRRKHTKRSSRRLLAEAYRASDISRASIGHAEKVLGVTGSRTGMKISFLGFSKDKIDIYFRPVGPPTSMPQVILFE